MISSGEQLFIGWDVGGWNCDRNPSSRDALVARNNIGMRVGQPWRGNLKHTLNNAATATDFRDAILSLCKLQTTPMHMTIAIDAPLGFPKAFIDLISRGGKLSQIGKSATNPYLYRETERRLAAEGITPLSAVKDMIGSQSTKAMHAIASYGHASAPGVWSDGVMLTFIETYPALCRARDRGAFNDLSTAKNAREIDILDADVCAQIARAFVLRHDWLEPPPEDLPDSEGWIWAPRNVNLKCQEVSDNFPAVEALSAEA
jgi:hypothetical protein